MSKTLQFTVPMIPPSLNHYVKHTRSGRHYTTGASTAFKDAVAIYARHQYVTSKSFSVKIVVVLGAGERGDIDNFPKLILDGLKECGAFQHPNGKPLSDAYVNQLILYMDKKRRPECGETQITVEAL